MKAYTFTSNQNSLGGAEAIFIPKLEFILMPVIHQECIEGKISVKRNPFYKFISFPAHTFFYFSPKVAFDKCKKIIPEMINGQEYMGWCAVRQMYLSRDSLEELKEADSKIKLLSTGVNRIVSIEFPDRMSSKYFSDLADCGKKLLEGYALFEKTRTIIGNISEKSKSKIIGRYNAEWLLSDKEGQSGVMVKLGE